MSYEFSGPWKSADLPAFFEKAYRRAGLADWDARWQTLSVQSRNFFLHVVKGPDRYSNQYRSEPSVPSSQFPRDVLDELKSGGFIELKAAKPNSTGELVYAAAGVHDFATRMRALPGFHLLDKGRPSTLLKYVEENLFSSRAVERINVVLSEAGISHFVPFDIAISHYVAHRYWPAWVAGLLKNPLAGEIIEVIKRAGGSLPLGELPVRLDRSHPDKVREVTDDLICHLALFEDLRPDTWELMVGLLPAVYEEMILAAQPRERPSLVICEYPQKLGPEGSVMINDIRDVLLEVACEPPQLRQDRSLYQKEMERFEASLEPLPTWLLTALNWNHGGRIDQAITWGRALRLATVSHEGKRVRLHISPKGRNWLSAGIAAQYVSIYEVFTSRARLQDIDSEYPGFTFPGIDAIYRHSSDGSRFLGERAAVLNVKKQFRGAFGEISSEDQIALREHLDRAFSVLKPGVFYRLDSVAPHIAFGTDNPINRGLPVNQVSVEWAYQRIPPLEEERERVGKLLIETFVWRRLIPLGCARAAVDDEGKICIAREPRYDAYFGRRIDPIELAPNAILTGRVVVQPDYTVVVIGLNTGAVTELVPFCERAARGGGQEAMILKITRESVIKAVHNGLNAEEIAARLKRHASNEVPASVLRQVREWATWLRKVSLSRAMLIECPDSDTADRVMAVFHYRVRRVSETIVAFYDVSLSPNERKKLKDYGIIAQED